MDNDVITTMLTSFGIVLIIAVLTSAGYIVSRKVQEIQLKQTKDQQMLDSEEGNNHQSEDDRMREAVQASYSSIREVEEAEPEVEEEKEFLEDPSIYGHHVDGPNGHIKT